MQKKSGKNFCRFLKRIFTFRDMAHPFRFFEGIWIGYFWWVDFDEICMSALINILPPYTIYISTIRFLRYKLFENFFVIYAEKKWEKFLSEFENDF